MLRVEDLVAGYGSMQVLWQPTFEVKRGSITALLGPNGAGKSTLLWTVLGSVRPWQGRILYAERDITTEPPHTKVARGMTLVPEGKHLFRGMTVQENLLMGAYRQAAFKEKQASLALVYTMFPVLKERARQRAGSLSGGEQQMLTLGRALMARPNCLMLDEPSQGLAPKLVGEVFETIAKLKTDIGLTILLVEQNVEVSLQTADYVYIMHEGRIKAEGTPGDIAGSTDIREAYLGM
jgi:branched-chain amino acid transport system ATP-binding protein